MDIVAESGVDHVVTAIASQERRELLATLAEHRSLFLRTVQGISDDEARCRTTVSELTLGGLIKHVSLVETGWANFIRTGPRAASATDEESANAHAAGFEMVENDTLARLIDAYERATLETDELVRNVPSLDASHPLPEAPWFEPGASWSARRVILHIIAETAQHAGHADIIRESLDGAKTMG